MREKQAFSTEARVGAVILVALLLLAWLTFQVGEFSFGKKGYTIEAVFKTVAGLEAAAKVKIAGVPVGTVERIYLKQGRAHVVLRLDDGVEVRKDSVVGIGSVGILSESFVDISAGSPDAPVLRPGAVVAGKDPLDIAQLVAQLSEVAGTITSLAGQIGATFGGKDSSLSKLMENFDGLIGRLNVILDENRAGINTAVTHIGELAKDGRAVVADNREELRRTIANLREFSASLNQRVKDLSDEVSRTAGDIRGAVGDTRAELKPVMEKIQSVADKADRAADSLTSILAKVDEGKGTIGKLVNQSTTVDGFDRAVSEFGDVAQKINAGQGTLGRLVTDDKLITSLETSINSIKDYLGKGDKNQLFLGYRGEYLAESSDLKHYVSVKIQPKPDKYYLLELVDDPAGRRTTTETTTEIEQPNGTYTVTERTTVDDKSKLKFTVQFAKSYGDFTMRGGLIESTGGVAVDYQIPGDRARLTLEGFDFGREQGAHVKLSGRYRFYKDFFVNAGVDDLSEKEARTVFLGAGLLFSDEDLKYLLSLASLGK
jgi:phospholipid/cholesterol/gamma-HCH transport system substrate-binding protein